MEWRSEDNLVTGFEVRDGNIREHRILNTTLKVIYVTHATFPLVLRAARQHIHFQALCEVEPCHVCCVNI